MSQELLSPGQAFFLHSKWVPASPVMSSDFWSKPTPLPTLQNKQLLRGTWVRSNTYYTSCRTCVSCLSCLSYVENGKVEFGLTAKKIILALGVSCSASFCLLAMSSQIITMVYNTNIPHHETWYFAILGNVPLPRHPVYTPLPHPLLTRSNPPPFLFFRIIIIAAWDPVEKITVITLLILLLSCHILTLIRRGRLNFDVRTNSMAWQGTHTIVHYSALK